MPKTEEHDAFVEPRVAREHKTIGTISQSIEDGKEGIGQSTKDPTTEIGWMTITKQ